MLITKIGLRVESQSSAFAYNPAKAKPAASTVVYKATIVAAYQIIRSKKN